MPMLTLAHDLGAEMLWDSSFGRRGSLAMTLDSLGVTTRHCRMSFPACAQLNTSLEMLGLEISAQCSRVLWAQM